MGGKLMLGDRVKYTINGHEWIGTVVAIRSSGTTIWSPYNNMERPGIQFAMSVCRRHQPSVRATSDTGRPAVR